MNTYLNELLVPVLNYIFIVVLTVNLKKISLATFFRNISVF